MERRYKGLLVAGILVLGIVSLLGAWLGQNNSYVPIQEPSPSKTCEHAIDARSQALGEETPFEIPESCFQNGEPVIDEPSNATPSDMIKKTSSGLKIVQSSSR